MAWKKINLDMASPFTPYCLTKVKVEGETRLPNVGNTIEFRQHRGTLDGEEAVNWLQVCAALFRLARPMDEDNLLELLNIWVDTTAPDPEYEGLDYVLRNIICVPPGVAGFYRGRVKSIGEEIIDESELPHVFSAI
jgi:hypothetical protein